MTRSQLSRLGFIGAAVAVVAAGMTVQAPEAKAWWSLTPRDAVCWTIGCPLASGQVKCAEAKGELSVEKVGTISVTYFCYFPDKTPVPAPPEGEM